MIPATIDDITATWLARHIGGARLDTVERIGADHGFASVTARVRGSLETGQSLDLAVKLGTSDRLGREIWFYRTCAPTTPIDVPGFRFFDIDHADGRAVLAIDHLGGAEQGDVLTGTTDARIEQLARMLARLHHRWWGADQPELDEVRDSDRPSWVVREGRIDRLIERHRPRLGTDEVNHLRRIEASARSADDFVRAGPVTLIHADVHLDNVMFDRSGRPFLLDWEGVRIGTPAEDLVRLAAERGTGGPVAIERLIDAYGQEIRRVGGAIDDSFPDRLAAALVGLQAGVINWLGNPERSHGQDRMGRVAERSMETLLLAGTDATLK